MNNPILWIFAVVVVVLCIVMVVLAGRSFGSREKRMKEFYQKANRQKELYEKYKDMSPENMKAEPADDVFEGLAVAVQKQLEDEISVNEAFLKLPDGQKFAYAAYYFFFDSADKLSTFFRKNGEPLLGAVMECLNAADADPDILRLIRSEYEMLDENNESVSVDNEKIAEWDNAFAQSNLQALKESVKLLILEKYEN